MTERITQIIQQLEREYGRTLRYSTKTPIQQLIYTVLSQRTNAADNKAAFVSMWEHFGSWENIMCAPVDELTKAIAASNYPEVKAPRIKLILKQIYEERGNFDLSFLQKMVILEASQWLMQLPGVGHKTTTFLLLFVFRMPVLPVDTHVHRVSQRTGIISTKVTEGKAHQILLQLLPRAADELLNYHVLLFKHGRRICTWRQPMCKQCTISAHCLSFQKKQDLFMKYSARIG
ncbi:MAG: endonuclease III [Bacteroidota bacterium]